MPSPKAKKYWYTVAYFTREGAPHPAMTHANFAQHYTQLKILREDLQRVMSDPRLNRGAYAAVLWPGQLSEWTAIHGDTRPLLNVYEGGRTERL